MWKKLLCAATICTVTGCAYHAPDKTSPASADAFFDTQLSSAAADISKQLDKLMAMQAPAAAAAPGGSAMAVEHPVTQPAPTSGDLARPASGVFNGEAKKVLADIAKRMGWKFMEAGTEPMQPIIVAADGNGLCWFKVIEAISFQMLGRGDISLDENMRGLTLAYRNPFAPGASAPHGRNGHYERRFPDEQNVANGEKTNLVNAMRQLLPRGWKYSTNPAIRRKMVTLTDNGDWRSSMEATFSPVASVTINEKRHLISVGIK